MLRENVAGSSEKYEITAINVMPDENDLSKYKIRKYDDNSVVCKGKCDLESCHYRKVHLVMDLNQDGIPYYREKTQSEIENGYEPSEELKNKMNPGNQQMVVSRNLLRSYFTMQYRQISRLYRFIKGKLIKNNVAKNGDEQSKAQTQDKIEVKQNKEVTGTLLEEYRYEPDWSKIREDTKDVAKEDNSSLRYSDRAVDKTQQMKQQQEEDLDR